MNPRYDAGPGAPGPRPRVLAVDDEPVNLRLVQAYLANTGLETLTAPDGPRALSLLESAPVDLVLLDVRMPQMSGFEVCRRIREDRAKARIPIIFLTAEYKDLESELRGFDSGADEYLHKPVERRALVARVRSLLRLASAERERQLAAQLAQAEKLAVIGQIAAGVAHEINNPLCFILSNLDVLTGYLADVRGVLDAYARGPEAGAAAARQVDLPQILGDIEALIGESAQGGDRVRRIVQQLKTFSRADDEGPPERLDLSEVAAATLLLTQRELGTRARVLRELEPAVLVGPRARLYQLVLNLVVNAFQALPPDGPGRNEIRVRTATEGDEVVLSVTDTGCGIPLDLQPRIFDPFFTTKPVGIGTGLGLSVCASVAAKLGGRMLFESAPGQGTTFTLRAPAAPPAAVAA